MTRRKPFLRSCVPAFLRLNNTRHYNQKTRNEWVRKDFGLKVCSLIKIIGVRGILSLSPIHLE